MRSKNIPQTTKPRFRVKGQISIQGTRYVMVRQGEAAVRFPLAEFMIDLRSVKAKLATGRVVLIGKAWSAFRDEVAALDDFRQKHLLEEVGWNGNCFGLPDGQVFAPLGTKAVAVYERSYRCESSGDHQGWMSSVAEPLEGQHLAVFLLTTAFVAPLLKLHSRTGNFGFELVGPPGKGKSTLLYVVASAVGRAIGEGNRYWNTCLTTANALEKKARVSSDLPLLLDDATAFAADQSGGVRGNAVKQLVHSLSHAETKDRWTGGPQKHFRLTFLMTSNLPLAEVLASVATSEAGATADRLLTLDLGVRENRNFDFVPEEYDDSKAFACKLEQAILSNFGTAMPVFLRGLVAHRAGDEQRLRQGIADRIETFIDRVKADRADGSAVRVAEAFAFPYVAGKLAQRYGALPKNLDVEEAAITAYRLFLASTERISYPNRVIAFLGDPTMVNIDAQGLEHVSDEMFYATPGFIRINRDGDREHLVKIDAFKRAFPDWRTVLGHWDLKGLFYPDGKHRGSKREVRKGKQDRLLVFKIDTE